MMGEDGVTFSLSLSLSVSLSLSLSLRHAVTWGFSSARGYPVTRLVPLAFFNPWKSFKTQQWNHECKGTARSILARTQLHLRVGFDCNDSCNEKTDLACLARNSLILQMQGEWAPVCKCFPGVKKLDNNAHKG